MSLTGSTTTSAGRPPTSPGRSWCWPGRAPQIIRAHAESFSLPPEFSVIDPPDVTNLMDTLRAENGLLATQRRAPRAGICADIYTRCVNTRAPVPAVIKAQFPWVTGFEA